VSTSQTFAGPLTSAEMNSLPQGTLGYAPVTANQGSITALVDLTGLTVTVTLVAGRRIRITGDVSFTSSVAADNALCQIVEGATVLNSRSTAIPAITTPAGGYSCHVEAVLTPTAAAHTYKLQAQRNGGSGNITMVAAATQPAFILVEDIGT
jgi:hypothetical protein